MKYLKSSFKWALWVWTMSMYAQKCSKSSVRVSFSSNHHSSSVLDYLPGHGIPFVSFQNSTMSISPNFLLQIKPPPFCCPSLWHCGHFQYSISGTAPFSFVLGSWTKSFHFHAQDSRNNYFFQSACILFMLIIMSQISLNISYITIYHI